MIQIPDFFDSTIQIKKPNGDLLGEFAAATVIGEPFFRDPSTDVAFVLTLFSYNSVKNDWNGESGNLRITWVNYLSPVTFWVYAVHKQGKNFILVSSPAGAPSLTPPVSIPIPEPETPTEEETPIIPQITPLTYRAVVSQSADDNPTSLILSNTTNKILNWVRAGTGEYFLEFFPLLQVSVPAHAFVFIQNPVSGLHLVASWAYSISPGDPTTATLYVGCTDNDGNLVDVNSDFSIQIDFYP